MHNGFIVTDSMRNNKQYDGKTLKFGITDNNDDYIVKLPKDTISSLYSEHVASRFIRNLGIDCHETWLGYYNKQPVVILKDFTTKEDKLRSFASTGQSSEDTTLEGKKYTYKDVTYLIKNNNKFSSVDKQNMMTMFWDMFICDAILGNRDRHKGNWGYMQNENKFRPAPLYDNGASLFPDVETRMHEYVEHIKNNTEYRFIYERSEKFPASLFQVEYDNGKCKRTNYYEILSDLRISPILAKEVKILRNKKGFTQVYEAITRSVLSANNIIPYEYKRFYILITCTRYLHLIERKSIKESYLIAYRRLMNETRTIL